MTNTGSLPISTRRPMLPTPDEMAAAQAVWDARRLVCQVPSLAASGRVDELEKTFVQMLQTFTGFGVVAWEVLELLGEDPLVNLDVAETVTSVVDNF